MAKWFYQMGDRESGPIDSAELKKLAKSGQLEPQHRVRREGSTTWYSAGQVKGLFASGQSQSTSQSSPPGAAVFPSSAPTPEESPAVHNDHTSTIIGRIKGAARLASKHAALKTLQLMEIFPADLAIGMNAYRESLGRKRFAVPYEVIDKLEQELQHISPSEAVVPHESVSERSKRLARETKRRVNVELLQQKKKKRLAELGRAIRESGELDAEETVAKEIIRAQNIVKRAAVLEQEITQLSANQPIWARPQRMITVAAAVLGLLATSWILGHQVMATDGRAADVTAVKEFLGKYRNLRKEPQLKLLDYAEGPPIEWRCLVHGTSQSGLGWLFAHLPSSNPTELELMIIPEDPTLESRIWPELQERRLAGMGPYLEVAARGRIVSFHSRGTMQSAVRVNLADATIAPIDAASSISTSVGKQQSDVVAAERFLADWKNVDSGDPDGTHWLNEQLTRGGYPLDCVIRWRCKLREYAGEYFRGDLYGATAKDPEVHIHLNDFAVAKRIVREKGQPHEVIVEGHFSGCFFSRRAYVEIMKAGLFAVDDGSPL